MIPAGARLASRLVGPAARAASTSAGPKPPPPAPAAASSKAPKPSSSQSDVPPAAAAPNKAAPEAKEPAPSLANEYMALTEMGMKGDGEVFGERTGARSAIGGKSSIERRRSALAWTAAFGALAGAVAYGWHSGRDWESESERDKMFGRCDDPAALELARSDEWAKQRLGRARVRFWDMLDYFNKPAWDPLLPDPFPPPHNRPYTLVIDLDDMLVHSGWDRENGWRTAKRPGVDYFLAYLSQFYEIVLFTTQPPYTAAPIVEKLDPYGAYIPWKLFRESTRYKNKALVKDLSYLGRPLAKTIVLDTDRERLQLQPENLIQLKAWEGAASSSKDTKELVDLIPFLEALAIMEVPDVRPLLKHYEGKHIPTAYAEAEAKSRQLEKEKWEAQRQGAGGWVTAAFGGVFGSSGSKDTPPEGKVATHRRFHQAQYLAEQKYWKDNEEEIKKQMDADREAQMKGMRNSFLDVLSGKASQPPEPPK